MKRGREDEAGIASAPAAPAPAASSAEPPPPQQLAYVNMWYYDDVHGMQQGPFSSFDMKAWFATGFMPDSTPVAPSWYGEVPTVTWPISTIWEDATADAFAMAADAEVHVPVAAQPAFMPSDWFDGPREGFAFRTGDYGLGYYRDIPPTVEIT